MPKSSTTPARGKLAVKPWPDFPLTAHRNGQFCKKIRGTIWYFGPVSDPQAAMARWLEDKEDLLAGRRPRRRRAPGETTIEQVVNDFLNAKRIAKESGELAQRSFDSLYATSGIIAKAFGTSRVVSDLGPADFQELRHTLAKRLGPVSLGNEIQRIKTVFRWAGPDGAALFDRPVSFGPEFKKPSAKTLRANRAKGGLRMFTQEEFRKTFAEAGVNLRAMLLLGVNAALGNTDLALMPIKAVDLDGGWLDYPRAKTAIPRRIPLWPETVKAIREALAARAEPKNAADNALLFIGPRGESYIGNHRGYRVCSEVTRAITSAKIARPGLSFYALRHTFQTVAEGSRDLSAVQAVMGHAAGNSDMSAVYRERVDDDRLRAVVDHVHKWLYPPAPKEIKRKPRAK